jgi:hypothetical protein
VPKYLTKATFAYTFFENKSDKKSIAFNFVTNYVPRNTGEPCLQESIKIIPSASYLIIKTVLKLSTNFHMSLMLRIHAASLRYLYDPS